MHNLIDHPYTLLSDFLQAQQINRFALAVSGGADSMAMTKLVAHYKKKQHSTVCALTVDHKLRPESTQEATHVNKLCEALGVQHVVLTWEHQPITSRLQERARQARYRLLSDWCKEHQYQYLLLAHHANDALETFMMRLSKGSSLKGLCGLKPLRTCYGITLVRPFLSLPREILHTALEGQEYVEDPSNENTRFERVRLRKWLSQMDILDGFLKSHQKLQQADAILLRLANEFAAKHIRQHDIDLLPLLALDPYLFACVLKTFVLDDLVEEASILRLRHALSEGKAMTLNYKKFEILESAIVRVTSYSKSQISKYKY